MRTGCKMWGCCSLPTHFRSAGQFSGRGLQTASCLLRQPPKHLSRELPSNDQRISEVDAVVHGLILGVTLRGSVSGAYVIPTLTFIQRDYVGGVEEVIGHSRWRDRQSIQNLNWGKANPRQWISTTVLPYPVGVGCLTRLAGSG